MSSGAKNLKSNRNLEPDSSQPSQASNWGRILLFVSLLLTFSFVYWQFGDLLSLEKLAGRESEFRDSQLSNPWIIYGLAFIAYVVVAGLSLPGTAAYVYAKASVLSLQSLADRRSSSIVSPRLLIAFVILGLFSLIAKYSYAIVRRQLR
tara:strand:+ start:9748 stop:10194 length:447 start_codon:yes stop_codon:yes gene_type:complete